MFESAFQVLTQRVCGDEEANSWWFQVFSASPSRWPRCSGSTIVSHWKATSGSARLTAISVKPGHRRRSPRAPRRSRREAGRPLPRGPPSPGPAPRPTPRAPASCSPNGRVGRHPSHQVGDAVDQLRQECGPATAPRGSRRPPAPAGAATRCAGRAADGDSSSTRARRRARAGSARPGRRCRPAVRAPGTTGCCGPAAAPPRPPTPAADGRCPGGGASGGRAPSREAVVRLSLVGRSMLSVATGSASVSRQVAVGREPAISTPPSAGSRSSIGPTGSARKSCSQRHPSTACTSSRSAAVGHLLHRQHSGLHALWVPVQASAFTGSAAPRRRPGSSRR